MRILAKIDVVFDGGLSGCFVLFWKIYLFLFLIFV